MMFRLWRNAAKALNRVTVVERALPGHRRRLTPMTAASEHRCHQADVHHPTPMSKSQPCSRQTRLSDGGSVPPLGVSTMSRAWSR